MNTDGLHPIHLQATYARVILPLAVPNLYTYFIPPELAGSCSVGMRVEVNFGKKKRYAALIAFLDQNPPKDYVPKPVLSVLDDHPICSIEHIQFWEWIANYYCCTIGEVMNAALPGGFRLASETKLHLSPLFDIDNLVLNDKEYTIVEALRHQNEISLSQVKDILGSKSVMPVVNKLLRLKLIYIKEQLKGGYKPKIIKCIQLKPELVESNQAMSSAFEKTSKSPRQEQALLFLLQETKKGRPIRLTDVYSALPNADISVLRALEKKGLAEIFEEQVSRLKAYSKPIEDKPPLSETQTEALTSIQQKLSNSKTVLLHGVTGSGKTRLYIELIEKALQRGEQVLYLLPEIALTTQIIQRMQRIFGDKIGVYHSRMSDHERVETWHLVNMGCPIVIGARSSIWLPFQNLGLVIIDESHDGSFKQYDPAPRYNARDAALVLAKLFGADTILGTATPSLESVQNVKSGKFALVRITERFGSGGMPDLVIIDNKESLKRGTLHGHFTKQLLDQIQEELKAERQVILFQNRRGYAPVLQCLTCGHNINCENCDVSLTYHKGLRLLKCHYCNLTKKVPTECPACGSLELKVRGFGTEQIEEEIQLHFPEAKIQRMDFDTVKGKHTYSRILQDFEERRIDILVGTQMVSKGLDFDHVGLVGILSVDHLLQWPDFRSVERAFQMMTQVSGRAGRQTHKGVVMVQGFNLSHPVLKEFHSQDFESFFERELKERQSFNYPPFSKLIKIQLKHKKAEVVNEASKLLHTILTREVPAKILGPALPPVPRVRNLYLIDILIKLPLDHRVVRKAKRFIMNTTRHLTSQKGFTSVRVKHKCGSLIERILAFKLSLVMFFTSFGCLKITFLRLKTEIHKMFIIFSRSPEVWKGILICG